MIFGLVHNKAGFAAFEVGAGSIRADPASPSTSWPGPVTDMVKGLPFPTR
jgi:hypothetical protein